MNVYSIFNIPRGYSFMYIFNDIKCFYYYCRISSSRHYIYLFVNVTFITTNNCTFKSSILEYCCLADLTVAISFFFCIFPYGNDCCMGSRIFTLGWVQLTSACFSPCNLPRQTAGSPPPQPCARSSPGPPAPRSAPGSPNPWVAAIHRKRRRVFKLKMTISATYPNCILA